MLKTELILLQNQQKTHLYEISPNNTTLYGSFVKIDIRYKILSENIKLCCPVVTNCMWLLSTTVILAILQVFSSHMWLVTIERDGTVSIKPEKSTE